MSALPRPDLAPGPKKSLNDALHDLHHRAGWPSLRTLARDTGVSHTTVSKVLSAPALPSWGTLELLVEAMDGDAAVFHELWLAASTPSNGAPAPAPRIAGRHAELEAVRRHLETGTGLLLVTGEAGMGKTRLVTTAAETVETFVAVGHCLPLSTEVPLLPLVDLLQRVHEVDRGRWFEEALTDCPAYTRGSIARLLPDISSASTDPDDDAPQRLLLALRALFEGLTSRHPLALLLEDLHWADASTLDAVEHLLARGVAVPVVGTWRTEDDGTTASMHAWRARVRRLPGTTELHLRQLTRDETGHQMALLTGHEPDPATVDRIHARTRGHPLFTDQLTAQATDDRSLPSLLVELFEQRLAGTTPTATQIAHVLGVATRPLDPAVVAAATGLDAESLSTGLRELLDRRLLAAPNGRGDVGLRHPLLAEAVVAGLVGGQATDVHRHLADALGRSPNPVPAEIATHFQRAGDRQQELVWRVHAARAAAARFAHSQEAEQWSRVLALWPSPEAGADTLPATLSDVHADLMQALMSAGSVRHANEVATQALATVDALPAEDAARLLRLAADCRGSVEGPEPALELLDRALALHEALPMSPDHARAFERRAGQLRALGRYTESAAAVSSAVAISAALGNAKEHRGMLAILAWHEQMAGDSAAALAHAQHALDIRLPQPDPRGDIWVAVCVTDLLLTAEAPAEQIADAGRLGLQAADEWDVSAYSASLVLSNVAGGWVRAGQVARAAELVDPRSAGPVTLDSWPTHARRALVDTLRGDLESARVRFDQLDPEDVVQLANRAELVVAAGELDLWVDHPRSQLGRALRLLDEVAPTDASEFMGALLVQAARATADQCAVSGDAAAELRRLRDLHARMLVDPFAPTAVPGNRSAAAASWAAELARLSRADTVELWVTAATEWDRLTRPLDSAYCRWRGTQVALRSGQGTVAARLLRRAATDAREHVPLSQAIAATRAGAR